MSEKLETGTREPELGTGNTGHEGDGREPELGTRDTGLEPETAVVHDSESRIPSPEPRTSEPQPELGTQDRELELEPAVVHDSESRIPSPESGPVEGRETAAARVSEPRIPSPESRVPTSDQPVISVPLRRLRSRSRRDFLLFGAGTLAAAAGFWWLLPDDTRTRHLTPRLRDWLDSLDARLGATRERRENVLNRGLTFDDDVAEALYSPNRRVRTYSKSQAIEPRNNYNGAIPRPDYIPGWTLTVSGLESGRTERFTIENLRSRFGRREQVTRLCCVEGWSAVAWWGGLSFADFLRAYPPAPGSRWAKLVSSVSLDFAGRPDPYYVSIDLPTARHPQTLLATELSGRPLTVEHGAPLRLVAPMKLGLKNIKAITSIEYTRDEPGDYWGERGYSKYDGL